jgi:hypothetical protein
MARSTNTDAVTAWADEFQQTLARLLSPWDLLLPPPEGPTTAEHLAALLKVRQALQVDEGLPLPGPIAAQQIASRVYGPNNRASLEDRLAEVVQVIERRVTRLLDTIPPAERGVDLVLTKDFGGALRFFSSPDVTERHINTGQPVEVPFVAALLKSLPEGHPLLSLDIDPLVLDRSANETGQPALVLGRSLPSWDRGGIPMPFYSLDGLKRWTRYFRSRQIEKDAEAERIRRAEERKEREAWAASPLGKLDAAQRALERMRAAGKVPEPVAAAPTVRQGKN